MKILFICNQNQNRSKTAEELFSKKFMTKSAGLFNTKPITEKEFSWADIIMVMEEFQRSELAQRFPQLYLQKRILSLDIPDEFHYNDPNLVELLQQRVKSYSELLS